MGYKDRIISDSSSLILLTKSNLIKYLLQKNRILIPKIIYKETIEEGKLKGAKDALELENYIKNDNIQIKEPTNKIKKFVEEICNLHYGERDVVALALEHKLSVLCDDKKGRNACKVFNINTISTLGLLRVLVKKRRISKNNALESLNILNKYGWYKNELIELMKKQIGG
jgi:predicted nucleic acid-binding protein